ITQFALSKAVNQIRADGPENNPPNQLMIPWIAAPIAPPIAAPSKAPSQAPRIAPKIPPSAKPRIPPSTPPTITPIAAPIVPPVLMNPKMENTPPRSASGQLSRLHHVRPTLLPRITRSGFNSSACLKPLVGVGHGGRAQVQAG